MSEQTVDIPILLPGADRCDECVSRLKEAVDAVPGVASVEVDPTTSFLRATFDEDAVAREQLVAEAERLGIEIGSAIGHASWAIGGLDCPDCARTVDVSVGHLDGVLSASLNFASAVLSIEYETAADPRAAVVDLVRRMGYSVEPLGDAAGNPIAEFRLVGLDCPDCAAQLERRVAAMDGVSRASVEFNTARMRVGYDPVRTDARVIASEIRAAGYSVELLGEDTVSPAPVSWWSRHYTEVATVLSGVLIVAGWLLARFASAQTPGIGAGAGLVAWSVPEALNDASVIAYLSSIALGGATVFRRAVSSARIGSLDMNVLMTVAVIGAVFIGEWAEGASVVFLFSVGGLLESRSLAKTRRSIRDLMELTPPTARVRRGGEIVELAPSEVVVGDRLLVRPGERVALDGVVAEGRSAIDESPITGESVPVDKGVGDEVYAGSLNTSGLLELDVTARAGDTTLSRIIYLVEEAQAQQAPFQRLVDRFTRRYTPTVVALAAAVAILPPAAGAALGTDVGGLETWFYRALVLLVVSCPCALVISTPVAVVSAITRATRDGVLVKGGAFLELAPKVRALAFDKTGTLTYGRPTVVDVVGSDSSTPDEVLVLAATLESHSTHPMARAVVRAASERGANPSRDSASRITAVIEIPGRGVTACLDGVDYAIGNPALAEEMGVVSGPLGKAVEELEARGRTALVVARLGDQPKVIGVIGVSDELRPAAAQTVDALRRSGIEHVVMLTGDNERVAEAIALEAGVTDVRARLLPEDKTEVVAALKERYGTVAMVGDGVNDAPALALADIGISMGAAGSDTALETADVALMSDDLAVLPGFLALGRRTLDVIRQNVWFSVAVKLSVLVAAVAGYAPLWLAVFADTGVALLVILNGLRLLRGSRVGFGA